MIHIVAIITAKPGMREAILKEFHANMPAVHAEKGCIEYGPTIDAEGIGSFQAKFGPDTFVVIEKWESPRGVAGARDLAAYGRLRRQDPRHDREPRHPRAAARVRTASNAQAQAARH
jgi:quinol monooxygenase YgiN